MQQNSFFESFWAPKWVQKAPKKIPQNIITKTEHKRGYLTQTSNSLSKTSIFACGTLCEIASFLSCFFSMFFGTSWGLPGRFLTLSGSPWRTPVPPKLQVFLSKTDVFYFVCFFFRFLFSRFSKNRTKKTMRKYSLRQALRPPKTQLFLE